MNNEYSSSTIGLDPSIISTKKGSSIEDPFSIPIMRRYVNSL